MCLLKYRGRVQQQKVGAVDSGDDEWLCWLPTTGTRDVNVAERARAPQNNGGGLQHF